MGVPTLRGRDAGFFGRYLHKKCDYITAMGIGGVREDPRFSLIRGRFAWPFDGLTLSDFRGSISNTPPASDFGAITTARVSLLSILSRQFSDNLFDLVGLRTANGWPFAGSRSRFVCLSMLLRIDGAGLVDRLDIRVVGE